MEEYSSQPFSFLLLGHGCLDSSRVCWQQNSKAMIKPNLQKCLKWHASNIPCIAFWTILPCRRARTDLRPPLNHLAPTARLRSRSQVSVSECFDAVQGFAALSQDLPVAPEFSPPSLRSLLTLPQSFAERQEVRDAGEDDSVGLPSLCILSQGSHESRDHSATKLSTAQ
jgi:hypothetical protein